MKVDESLSWERMFLEYALDPYRAWAGQSSRQAEKLSTRVKKMATGAGFSYREVVESSIEAASHRDHCGRPLTIFLVNSGSSGSHWLEPMLADLGDFSPGGEIYLPKSLRDKLKKLSPTKRTSFIDAVHLLHMRELPVLNLEKTLINTAHNWRLPELFHSEARTILLTRHPVDIVVSRTFRKDEYRHSRLPDASDLDYLKKNIEVVNTFYAKTKNALWDHQVSFEDLKSNGADRICELLAYLGASASRQQIEKVLEDYSVDGSAVAKTNLYRGPRAQVPDWARENAAHLLVDEPRQFGYEY
ncbi:sulfotransferase domain-containing protein [Nesterenkonia haasae]|uniref:sulfotransferase domain-containing protein n=1 Tax=Nesterenkonia haasae TaxID=2587813 RepID=UPI001390C647|nr:sulfotransferase domain-containing protein [Nesterenkonia haasae]NDK33189.1 hypothetical protein [Nesterenkonia haasae]